MADITAALSALTQSAQDSVTLMNAQTQAQAQVTQASITNQAERTVLEMANGAVAGMKSLTQSLVQNISR
jgi:hypothetical protein